MPRPAALATLPGFLSPMEMFHASLDEYVNSLTAADKLAFLNALRSGALFNFTPAD
ncbi:hypothetical protein [Mycobacterium sp. Root265]|uniref:hypothetical protein n=1 Tax=Mycobacterium sp. Root265 TaxID=1736504 RepID=UPI000AE5023F|nr:hypothetical protein [Mycobacterium sp. Root265]